MIVHFSSGALLYSIPLVSYPQEDILAFAKTIQSFGVTSDLRFGSIIEGRPVFIFARSTTIDFLEFDQEEYELMQKALNPKMDKEEP